MDSADLLEMALMASSTTGGFVVDFDGSGFWIGPPLDDGCGWSALLSSCTGSAAAAASCFARDESFGLGVVVRSRPDRRRPAEAVPEVSSNTAAAGFRLRPEPGVLVRNPGGDAAASLAGVNKPSCRSLDRFLSIFCCRIAKYSGSGGCTDGSSTRAAVVAGRTTPLASATSSCGGPCMMMMMPAFVPTLNCLDNDIVVRVLDEGFVWCFIVKDHAHPSSCTASTHAKDFGERLPYGNEPPMLDTSRTADDAGNCLLIITFRY
jgi:hypothetical protein